MKLVNHWRAMRAFDRLPAAKRKLVFYSEGYAYWCHFAGLVQHLTEQLGMTVCYVSSASDDPGLQQHGDRVLTFDIGAGAMRTVFFRGVNCGTLVMTMPDLGNMYIKRSAYPVHYAYVFHSLVSTHMVYRNRAFQHYDSLLCCGPHHIDELRATEALYGLPAAQLYEHGYGRLDSLIESHTAHTREAAGIRHVLVAPSWGPSGLFESGLGEALVENLLNGGFAVTVRPHPQTLIYAGNCWHRLLARFAGREGFKHEQDVGGEASLLDADLMISDWSGAALEYAFALERPVLFVDVPRKVNNPEYARLDRDPLEARVREEIGQVLSLDQVDKVAPVAASLCDTAEQRAKDLRALRSEYVFNVGSSARHGAEILAEIADRNASAS